MYKISILRDFKNIGKIMRLCDQDIEEWLAQKKLIITPHPQK